MLPSESDFADWIGRSFTRHEPVAERLVEGLRATLGPWLADQDAPPGLHWCLCPDMVGVDQLGRDAHPRTGIFLPALPFPRRMWAGGTLDLTGRFQPGDLVTRTTTIESIRFRQGRSGPLGFVAVRHLYAVGGQTVLDEVHDIVYRPDPAPGAVVAQPPIAPDLGAPLDTMELTPDPVLLFRFSALTFNGHRIHYDHPYATGVEGYDGLVVHGPLQAVLMLNLATRALGRQPQSFRYRGLSPLTVGKPIAVEAHGGQGGLALRVRITGGPVTMEATAV